MHNALLKKAAATAATVAVASLPLLANAQVDLGLEYATAIGLGTQDVRTTAAQVIRAFMSLLGVIAVVIILAGGFMWMIAGGDETKTKKARQLIISGVIGLVIILSAYAIASFIIGAITEGTGVTG